MNAFGFMKTLGLRYFIAIMQGRIPESDDLRESFKVMKYDVAETRVELSFSGSLCSQLPGLQGPRMSSVGHLKILKKCHRLQ